MRLRLEPKESSISKINFAMTEALTEEMDRYIDEVEVNLNIDGMRLELESNTDEIDRTGGEININIILGIKRMIQRHPEEYDEELHWPLFTDAERDEIERAKAQKILESGVAA